MPTDNAGHTPEVGDYVAYNWSGQIATGYIVSVGRSRYSPTYRIEQVLPGRQQKHSRVNGSRNVLVLQKGAEAELPEHPA